MRIYLMTILSVCGLVLVLSMTAKALDHLVSQVGVEQESFP